MASTSALVTTATSVLMSLALFGCGSFVPTVDIDDLPPQTVQEVRSIAVYDAIQLSRLDYSIVNIIEGHACQNKVWDAPATRAAAIEQLKYHAWEAGADAISNVQCGNREGTSARTNCWELISCTANAIDVQAAE